MRKANTVCAQEDSPEECEQKVKKKKYAKILIKINGLLPSGHFFGGESSEVYQIQYVGIFKWVMLYCHASR